MYQKMQVVRRVPFQIIALPQVSVPLNSLPVAYYRKGRITPCLRLTLRRVALVWCLQCYENTKLIGGGTQWVEWYHNINTN